jgi:hypothetical protein
MFLSFCDGEKVIKKFTKKYKRHEKGLFVLAPSGSGKTHLVKNQKENDWIDGDELWMAAGAQPLDNWWEQGLDTIFKVDQRCDVITSQARDMGFWIIGASNYWLIPDAIVLLDWRINKKYIIEREKNNYDGGAKSSDFGQVKNHRKFLQDFARKNNIPVYKSTEEAVRKLTA